MGRIIVGLIGPGTFGADVHDNIRTSTVFGSGELHARDVVGKVRRCKARQSKANVRQGTCWMWMD